MVISCRSDVSLLHYGGNSMEDKGKFVYRQKIKSEIDNSIKSMFDHSSLPFCIIRMEFDYDNNPEDLTFLYCNKSFADIENYVKEGLQRYLLGEVCPNTERKWLKFCYEAVDEKKEIAFDVISEKENQYWHINCIPIKQFELYACIFHDISKENEYKKELKKEKVSFRNIHNALTSGAWHLKFNQQWELVSVSWSDTLRKMLGFESEKDFPNTFETWSSRLHPEDRERILEEYNKTVQDHSGKKIFDVEYRIQSKSEKYHWFRAAGNLSRRVDGSPDSFDGVFINTDEKHESEEKYHIVLKEARDARNEAMIDHEIISAVSRLYFSIFRIDLVRDFFEEISSDTYVHRLTGHEGRAQQKMNELCDTIVAKEYREAVKHFFDLSTVADRLANTDTIEMEYRAMDSNWHEARFIEKKRDDNGRVTHVLYVTRIVSKQKQQELERERLRIAYQSAESANQAKTTFLLNMSHDIRTPMNAILGYTQLMKQHVMDPKALHYQEMIEKSGKLLLSIIDNVLDMARIESGKMELDENYNHAGRIVSNICEVFKVEAEKKNIQLIYLLHVQHSHIMCDVLKIEEIFTNLISNAIKYTPPGGKITVSVQEVPCKKNGYVSIETSVEDTGIGMSQKFLPHIFELFSRERNTTIGKVAGTGLGMAIIKSLIDLMGGTIKVESELGKGSKFTVIMQHKLADAKYYEKQERLFKEDLKVEFRGKHILLAEDNELNAEIAVAILEKMGFVVDRVEDGIFCVNKMEQEPAGTYDLILMDIQMPNMDGYKATQIIRNFSDEKKAKIPIIAMTANAFEEDRKRAVVNGMNGHIAKPIDALKIEETLKKILNNKIKI